MSATVVIHGGAGSAFDGNERQKQVRRVLDEILDRLWTRACEGAGAMDLVEEGCAALENCPHFNAGLGSKLQRDGVIRMSASIMDGNSLAFSGVINVEEVQNPIELASALQNQPERVLDGRGAEWLARKMEIPPFDPIVERRLQRWLDKAREHRLDNGANQSAKSQNESERLGTVGVVACDEQGRLAASTSTGGRGFERSGRVSDTATVAGNYATERVAVSCTGNGEDIVDEALAARIAVFTESGMSLEEAMSRAIDEAGRRQRRVAAIAVDDTGAIEWGKTTEVLLGVGRTDENTEWAF